MKNIITQSNITRQASMEACLFAVKKAEELNININVSLEIRAWL